MNDRLERGWWIWALAIAVLLMGFTVAGRSFRLIRETTRLLDKKQADIETLRSLDRRVRPGEVARRRFEEMAVDPAAVSLDDLAARVMAGVHIDDSRTMTDAIEPGWNVRRVEWTLHHVPFDPLMTFVREAEAQRPPWRLVECTLRASSASPGAGQAVIMLETVERK